MAAVGEIPSWKIGILSFSSSGAYERGDWSVLWSFPFIFLFYFLISQSSWLGLALLKVVSSLKFNGIIRIWDICGFGGSRSHNHSAIVVGLKMEDGRALDSWWWRGFLPPFTQNCGGGHCRDDVGFVGVSALMSTSTAAGSWVASPVLCRYAFGLSSTWLVTQVWVWLAWVFMAHIAGSV